MRQDPLRCKRKTCMESKEQKLSVDGLHFRTELLTAEEYH